MPDLRLALDGLPLTESHCLAGAWPLGVPVLGIVGDAAPGPELTGALAGTPFLAVKRSNRRVGAGRSWLGTGSRRRPAPSRPARRAGAGIWSAPP